MEEVSLKTLTEELVSIDYYTPIQGYFVFPVTGSKRKRETESEETMEEAVDRLTKTCMTIWMNDEKKQEEAPYLLLSAIPQTINRDAISEYPNVRHDKELQKTFKNCVNLYEIVYKECQKRFQNTAKNNKDFLEKFGKVYLKCINTEFPARYVKRSKNCTNPEEPFSTLTSELGCSFRLRTSGKRWSPLYHPREKEKRKSIPNFLEKLQ